VLLTPKLCHIENSLHARGRWDARGGTGAHPISLLDPRAYAARGARPGPGLEACDKGSRVTRATAMDLALVHDRDNIALISDIFNFGRDYLAARGLPRKRS
jgi:hypothetical protein